METPSSTRRVTRSQTMNSAKKFEECEVVLSKSRLQDVRSALVDITNDSPIVGLALDTPSSGFGKNKNCRVKMTPGSGEALLRGQVKNLLQKVEEEAEISKISLPSLPVIRLPGYVNSPTALLAPTPANTPLFPNLHHEVGVDRVTVGSPVVEEELRFTEEVGAKKENEASVGITRSLLLDFSDKCSSDGECTSKERSTSSSSSVWSMQVNASSVRDEDEIVDDLCLSLSTMKIAEFTGKHTRFEYNSDDELVEVREGSPSPSVVRLKGLPSPKGKHVRFEEEE